MSTLATNSRGSATRATTIPCLVYRDTKAAMQWLCSCFGFEKKAAYADEQGRVMHAELTFGSGMVMLGTCDPGSEFGKLIRQPDEIGGKETQTVYIVVSDPDEVYQRVLAGGGQILREIRDESYGGRGFTCADPQGHIWSIGSYDPWA